jgi:hypothetical protein
MTEQDSISIAIKLSPAQVDEVVRAAADSRAPSISTLIADALSAPLRDAREDASSDEDVSSEEDASSDENELSAESSADDKAPTEGPTEEPARSRLERYMPIGTVDPRLSRSLLRGLSILTCFGPDGDARGIVEIAEELGMSPSTTHRYALTLVELGLLERHPHTRKYRLPRA